MFATFCVTGLAALSFSPLALAAQAPPPTLAAQAPAAPAPAEGDLQSPPPSKYTEKIVDHSGVLSSSDKAELEEMIRKMQVADKRVMYVILQPSFGGMDPETFAKETLEKNNTDNVLIFVIATEDRQYAFAHHNKVWSESAKQGINDAAYPFLANLDFKGAVYAAVKEAGGDAVMTPEEAAAAKRTGYTVLGTGAAGTAALGGGLWLYSRRRKAKAIESAREIQPGNVTELSNQPYDVLQKLAQEELVSTDESIRRGRAELDLAIAEFGAERVRPFTSAMNTSTSTLQRAFQLKQQVDSGGGATQEQRKSMLIEIISSCGLADDALDNVAAEFADLRNLLVNAPSKIEEITQQSIDIRTRIPRAAETLAGLRQRYAPSIIDSIDENVELATELVNNAESSIDSAREQMSMPVGSQGGVVDAIRNAENALAHADKALSSIENAATDISAAQAGIGAVISEIEAEVEEGNQLKELGQAHGAKANWDKVTETLSRAPQVIAEARETAEADPLTTYSKLVEFDAELDLLLDTVRESNQQQARALQIFDNTLRSAESALNSADNYIGTRGSIVGSAARAQLADAHRHRALALQHRTSDTRLAIESAQTCLVLAKRASKAASNDVSAHYNRNRYDNNFTTGMIAGHILSSGSSGGFSGGFSGGGFSGGGGGISTSSGSF